jgi:hypothetical protein
VLFKQGGLNRNELVRIDLNKTKRINEIKLASFIQPENRELKKLIPTLHK